MSPPLARLAALAVPLVGVAELIGHVHFATSAPRLEEWAALREPVAAMKEAGDLVVVAPRWAEPNARWAFGDGLMPLRDVARPDESAYRRAVEVSALGQTAPELEGWPAVEEREIGRFVVRVRRNPSPANVRFEFTDHVDPEHASAFVERPGGRIACPWTKRARVSAGGLGGHPTFPARRFDCPGNEAYFVGVTVIDDEHYRPRRCIWAHPTAEPVVARFEDVPLGSVIRGYGALPWFRERRPSGSPIRLRVRVEGRAVGSWEHADGEGWKAFEFHTGAAGRRADVEFEVSSASPGARHFCFQADTR